MSSNKKSIIPVSSESSWKLSNELESLRQKRNQEKSATHTVIDSTDPYKKVYKKGTRSHKGPKKKGEKVRILLKLILSPCKY